MNGGETKPKTEEKKIYMRLHDTQLVCSVLLYVHRNHQAY